MKNETKRVVFEEISSTHAQMKVRLYYDGLTQTQFFRYFVKLYTSEDERFMSLVEELKEQVSKQGKSRRSKSKKLQEIGRKQSTAYNLSEKEKENIFDLIEREMEHL
jgi:hypothetical protein